MIKILRITSVIVATAAVVLLILPVVYGVRTDPQVEEFLKTPGAVEKFTAKGHSGAPGNKDESQGTPLVRQAMDFATYLNPPPPPPPPTQASGTAPAQTQPVAPMGPVSAKFDLVATSFFASNPNMSLALINEPGKGLNWVKQGSTVDRLTIEKVTDGSITIRDGQRTSEMTIKTTKELWRGLLKNPPPSTRPGIVSEVSAPGESIESPTAAPGNASVVPAQGRIEVQTRPDTPPGAVRARTRPVARAQTAQQRQGQPAQGANPGPAGSVVAGKVTPVSPGPAQSDKQDAVVQPASPAQGGQSAVQTKPVEMAVEPQPQGPPAEQGANTAPASTSPAESGLPKDEKQARMDQIITELSSSRVSDDEAGRMEKLVEELKKLQESEPSTGSAQQQPPTSGQTDTNSAEQNTTPDANL